MGINLPTHGPYRAVKEAVSLADVARRYTHLESVGGKAWGVGRCPLPDHADRTPSFYIYPSDTGEEAARFHCFGCGSSGDVIELHFRCGQFGEMYEAMLDLAYEYDVTLPDPDPERMSWMGEKHSRRTQARDILARSYQRRFFRVFCGDFLAGIKDSGEREREGRILFRELWPLSVAAAERRLFGVPR